MDTNDSRKRWETFLSTFPTQAHAISGLFQETAKVGGQPRKFLTYIPEGLDYCQPCLVAAIPSGEKPEEYLETSGLKAFAEDKKLFLHLATSETAGTRTACDADYLNAIYVAIQARDFYITMQDNIYLCGIGDGSFAAHQAHAGWQASGAD